MKIPKDLMFEYLLSLENYSESHPTLKEKRNRSVALFADYVLPLALTINP